MGNFVKTKPSSKTSWTRFAGKLSVRILFLALTGVMMTGVIFNLSGCASGQRPDNAQEVLETYEREMLQAIDSEKRYPYGALDLKTQGVVTIGFDYTVDGKADNLEIVKSSGDANLDHAALMAVYFAKLPPEPPALKGVTRFVVDVNFIMH